MSDLLKDGAVWLAGQLKAFASQTVQYVRGNSSVQVAATIGRSTFEVDNGAGGLLRLESRDYLILPDDLVLLEQAIKPREGDRITETVGSGTIVYEVARFGSEPCWRYDQQRTRMIVHTRQVSEVSQ